MYIYTTSRTSDRRAQRGLPLRQLLGNFSTALAGGRGAASASAGSRWQAPRGGSSAPPIWSRRSSACPTQARAAQRRSPRTVAASQRVSWFGREPVACEGGIETRVRARGVWRSSTRADNVCRLGGARPEPAVHFVSMGCCVSAAAPQRFAASITSGYIGLAFLKASRMSCDAGAVRLGAPIMLRAVVKAGSS